MVMFSACLSEVVPIIDLRGDAPTECLLSAGKKCRPQARHTNQLHGLRQLLIAALIASVASCNLTYARTSQQTGGIDPSTLNFGSHTRSREVDRQDYFMPGRRMPLIKSSLENGPRDSHHLSATSFAIDDGEQAYVRFPKELHGLWVGSEQSCPTGSEYFDGEFILDISAEEMFGYEEVYRPTKISLTSTSPKSWRIDAMVDVGPSGFFSDADTMAITLEKEQLKVAVDSISKTYKKCRLKIAKGGV